MSRDLKAVLRQGVPGRSWFGWLRMPTLVPSFAACSLLVLVGYQNLVTLPQLKAPRAGAAVILDPQTRAAVPQVGSGDSLHFQMPIDVVNTSDRLRVELLDASGQKRSYGEVQAPPDHQPLDVFFPGSAHPGRYVVTVRDATDDKEVGRGSFQIVPGPRHEGDSR
jgi:hypothetical protein